MLAKYQYMLQIPVSAVSGNKFDSLISLLEFYMDSRTDNEDAEEFSAYSLNTLPGKYKSEEVLLYGIEPDSRYVEADFDQMACIFPVLMRINFCFMWETPSL